MSRHMVHWYYIIIFLQDAAPVDGEDLSGLMYVG